MDLSTEALWLNGRFHPDLPPEAELAIRRAGALYHRTREARAELERALELAPEHLAVWIAHYRFHFYKHDYAQAETCARRCLSLVGKALSLAESLNEVSAPQLEPLCEDERLRFWLFAWQAYGYVLLRLGREAEGEEIFERLAALDTRDFTKTRVLLEVIRARESE
jgi:tetratricopeptide (TPR) repeat protein